MILTFDKAAVRQLLDHATAAALHSPTFGQMYDPDCRKDGREPTIDEVVTSDDVDPAKISAGLYLVGDSGVYLMSNGSPGLLKPKGGNVIAYARECNPETMSFDAWWSAKQASFGGDDGVDLIDAPDAANWINDTKGPVLRMRIDPSEFALIVDA